MSKSGMKETYASHRTGNLQMNIYETHVDIPYHWHDEYEFIYVRRGICKCIINGENIELGESELLLIQAGELHTVNTDATGDFFAIVVHPHILGTDCSKFFNSNIRFKRIFKKENAQDNYIIKKVIEIKKYYGQKQFGYELMLKSLIGNIFGTILKENMYSDSARTKNRNFEIFEKLIAHINEHYNEPITLDELSEISNFSKAYVIRLFKLNTGKTPIDYINRCRIYHAQELLDHTDKNIIDIAFECGFDNIGYFIKLFKRYLSTTPSKWRKGVKYI